MVRRCLHEKGGVSVKSDILEGKWKQLKGEVKMWWGRLTDDDLDQIAGSKDKLIGKLQERYGYAREQAEREADERLSSYDRPMTAR
jgi:uncharacterized protein YjbJ (UPF0337 family)